jgi:ABC-2 type transport system permease protein
VMLKGSDLATVQPQIGALLAFMLVFSLLALSRFRRTLD